MSAEVPFQPPLLGLKLIPTPAMRKGKQLVWQCSDCGCLVVQTDLAPGALGACPACGGTGWRRQEIPEHGSLDSLCGFRQGRDLRSERKF